MLALALGLSRPAATEFTFIVGIPTLLAASGLKIFKALRHPVAGAMPEDWTSVAIAFVVLPAFRSLPFSGSQQWGPGFLPASYQGTVLRWKGDPILDLKPPAGVTPAAQASEMDLLRSYNQEYLQNHFTNPDLKAVYNSNDDVALGAMQAVLATNRKGATLVTGMNGVPPALRAVKDGNLALTVELNAFEWGRLGVDMLDRILKGETVGKQVYIKHRLVDATNVDELLARLPKN